MARKRYSNILLAVDFHDDNETTIDTATMLAEMNEASLHLVHVNEPIGMAYSPDSLSWGDQVYALQESIRRESKQKLEALAGKLGVPSERTHLLEGRPSAEIHELCKGQGIDLVVLGTHGQSGLQLLLGSTANGVLHGSGCDVLAVRLG